MLVYVYAPSRVLARVPYDSGFGPDGILFDNFNDLVYVFSHPTHNAMVIDSHNGTALGYVAIGGPPEQGVSDGKGTLYVARQATGSVTVIDARTIPERAPAGHQHCPDGGHDRH